MQANFCLKSELFLDLIIRSRKADELTVNNEGDTDDDNDDDDDDDDKEGKSKKHKRLTSE